MSSYGLHEQIKSPTRICSTTTTCIDNVFTSEHEDCTSTLTGDFLTDHQGIIIKKKYDTNFVSNIPEIKRKSINDKRKNILISSLEKEKWFNFNKYITAEDKCNAFFETFMKHVDLALPMTENKIHTGEIIPPNLDENCSKQKENVKFCLQLTDRKSTRLNSSHGGISRMPSSA